LAQKFKGDKDNVWAMADVMELTRRELGTEKGNKRNAFLSSSKTTVI
jgi:hypothetical protein